MMLRLLQILEFLFLITIWWQTRVNLRHWWPDFFTLPLASDYVTPFVYLSDILLVMLLGVWVLYKIFSKNLTFDLVIRPSKAWLSQPFFWLAVLLVVAGSSIYANEAGWWSWYGWLRLVEGLGLAVYVQDRLQHRQLWGWYGILLVMGLVGVSGLLLMEWALQRSLGLQWIGEWRFNVFTPGVAKVVYMGQEYVRPHGTFAHPNIAGGVLALVIAGLSWWWVTLRYRKEEFDTAKIERASPIPEGLGVRWGRWIVDWRAVLFALMVLSLGLLVTFSRTAWLVAGVGVVLVGAVASAMRIRIRDWWKFIVVGIVAVGVLFGPMIWSRFDSLDGTDRLSYDRRVQLTNVAIDMVEQTPWLGVGIYNFVPKMMIYGPLYGVGIWREPVHNLGLLVLSEIGVIGLMVWTVAGVLIIAGLVRKVRGTRDTLAILLLVVWLQVVLLGMVDHYWWTNQQGRLVWWMLVGMSIAVSRQRPVQGG